MHAARTPFLIGLASRSLHLSESWFGVIGPRGLSPQLVKRVNADINAILKESAIRDKVVLEGARPGEGSPEAFAKIQLNEYTKPSTLIKTIGMKSN